MTRLHLAGLKGTELRGTELRVAEVRSRMLSQSPMRSAAVHIHAALNQLLGASTGGGVHARTRYAKSFI